MLCLALLAMARPCAVGTGLSMGDIWHQHVGLANIKLGTVNKDSTSEKSNDNLIVSEKLNIIHES